MYHNVPFGEGGLAGPRDPLGRCRPGAFYSRGLFQWPPQSSPQSAVKFDIISKKEPLREMLPRVKEKKLYLT